MAQVSKAVMLFTAKAKNRALHINARETVYIRQIFHVHPQK